MTDNKKVVINMEVTGLYPKGGHKLVEIAAIEIDGNDVQTGAVLLRSSGGIYNSVSKSRNIKFFVLGYWRRIKIFLPHSL